MRAGLLRALLACAALFASGCASTSPDVCPASGSAWYELGFEDGADGRSPDRLGGRRDDCGPRAQNLDEEAWQAGYEDGLTHFCSPAGGLITGSEGRTRPDVCPAGLLSGFNDGFRLGREIHETEQRMTEIEREIRALEARQAGGLLGPALRDDSGASIRRLEGEYDRLQRELRLLNLRADQMTRE